MSENSPSMIQSEIQNLTESDFVALRSYGWVDHHNFIDEEAEHPEPEYDIDTFKQHLEEVYIPYYSGKLKEYLSLRPDFFVLDGSSAVPYGYLFKAGFKRYATLHPNEDTSVPHFLFLDVGPLRQKAYKYEEYMPYVFDDFLQGVSEEELRRIYGDKAYKVLQKSLGDVKEHPNPKVLIFDEAVLSKVHSSLMIAKTFLTTQAPRADIHIDSPSFSSNSNRNINGVSTSPEDMIGSYHVYKPIKRINDPSGGFYNKSGDFRRPSLTLHPHAHKGGLTLIDDCQKLGRMIAEAA